MKRSVMQRILDAASETYARTSTSIGEPDAPPPLPKPMNVFKSVGSPFGTHPEHGVLNRKTRRGIAKKLRKQIKKMRAEERA